MGGVTRSRMQWKNIAHSLKRKEHPKMLRPQVFQSTQPRSLATFRVFRSYRVCGCEFLSTRTTHGTRVPCSARPRDARVPHSQTRPSRLAQQVDCECDRRLFRLESK